MITSHLNESRELATAERKSACWIGWSIGATALIAAVACLAMMSPELTAAWELNRAAIRDGEWTRLITGHITHWSRDHLFWDAATFLVLAIMCMRRRPLATVCCVATSSVAISAGVLAFHPELATYRGLSGLDTALFTLLAVSFYQDARRNRDRALAAVAKWGLASLVAKTAYELFTGDTLFVSSGQSGFIPLASAHAIGAIVGFLAAIASTVYSLLFTPRPSRRRPGLLSIPAQPAILRQARTAHVSVD